MRIPLKILPLLATGIAVLAVAHVLASRPAAHSRIGLRSVLDTAGMISTKF
jgi:hypothetical protein